MKIAILCSDDAHHRYLVALFSLSFNVVGIVVEPGASQRRRLLKLGRYRAYSWILYHHMRRRITGLDRYRRRYFADVPSSDIFPPPRMMTVDWVNDSRVEKFLAEIEPDITVIICTSILKKNILRAAGPTVINIHGGYLPYYRGNHCYFFALYNGEFDKIGSTIHYVDPGIDTGDIIDVVKPPIYLEDNAERLYCRGEMMAIHRLVKILKAFERGESPPRHAQSERWPLYSTADRKPHHDINFWLRRTWRRITDRSIQPNS